VNYNSRVPVLQQAQDISGKTSNQISRVCDYIFGKQPDTNWLKPKSKRGVLHADSLFNLLYTQDLQQQLNFTAQLEPLREFNIDVNVQKTFSKNYSELFKNPTQSPVVDSFHHLSPFGRWRIQCFLYQFSRHCLKNHDPTRSLKHSRSFKITV
jgi:cell surface protein SprA